MAVREDYWKERMSPVTQVGGDSRDCFERDLSRIIHSFAFRRLSGKMQVLGSEAGDFHRTRLTHSIEVAQIGRGIVNHIRNTKKHPEYLEFLPTNELIEATCLAHDLGHPPFGHAGEKALDQALKKNDSEIGFEGNGQTLRILSRLESHTEKHGLNLTRRLLLGILKYPIPYTVAAKGQSNPGKPPKCYLDTEDEVVEFIFRGCQSRDRERFLDYSAEEGHKSLDCSLMDFADTASYAIHDFEDGVFLRLIRGDQIKDEAFDQLKELLSVFDVSIEKLFHERMYVRKRAIGDLIHRCIDGCKLVMKPGFEDPILGLRCEPDEEVKDLLKHLNREIVFPCMIQMPHIRALELKGERILKGLFDELVSNGQALMPLHGSGRTYRNPDTSKEEQLRYIADYLSGMTDLYCSRMYDRLFTPGVGSIFDTF